MIYSRADTIAALRKLADRQMGDETMLTRQQKLLGGLYGSALGDAMGAATETRSQELIRSTFGGKVTEILKPPMDCYAAGSEAGQVTDDFSMAYLTLKAILNHDGELNTKVVEEALLDWASYPQYAKCAGPTTRVTIARLKGQETPVSKYDTNLCINSKSSNGAGMKMGPVGMLTPGDIDAAVDNAVVIGIVTHNNTVALSAAAAISAAAAAAMADNASMNDILRAGLYGAEEGFSRTLSFARPVASPSIARKIEVAIELGLRYQNDFERAMEEIEAIIGTGLPANEAIPAVFDMIAACKADTMETIYMGVNAGDDTDTVACMAGCIVGALNGVDTIPVHHRDLIDKINPFDMKGTAKKMEELIDAGKIEHARRYF